MTSSILLTFLAIVILGADSRVGKTEEVAFNNFSEKPEETTSFSAAILKTTKTIQQESTREYSTTSTTNQISDLNFVTPTATNLLPAKTSPTTATAIIPSKAEAISQSSNLLIDGITTITTMAIPATSTTQLVNKDSITTTPTASQRNASQATTTAKRTETTKTEMAATTLATTTTSALPATTIITVVSSMPEPPSSDSLTKELSIPTFLPAFPLFPEKSSSGASTASHSLPTTSLSNEQLQKQQQQQQEQIYLAAFNRRNHQASKNNRTAQKTNVTVQMGSHAYLPCHLRPLMNKPVSWVRVRDGHILTVDQTTFIADQRFQSIFKGENDYTWSLQIKYVQSTDEGLYECQVSTEPKMGARVFLEVVVPKTELIGDQNRFVKAGSKVALHCIVRGTLEPPSYIIWSRGKTQIMDDNKFGWYTQIDRNIFGNSSDQQNTIGSLIIPFVRKKDSGNYVCQPSNSESVSVDLHVLSGEYSASAIMSIAVTTHMKPNISSLFLIIVPAALART